MRSTRNPLGFGLKIEMILILGLFLSPVACLFASEPTVTQLVSQLNAKDPSVLQPAIYQLAQLGTQVADNDSAKRRLAELLRDLDQPESVREVAAYALGRIATGAAAYVPALESALHDKSSKVRRATVEALSRVGPNRADAISAVNEAFQTQDVVVKRACIGAFARMGDRELAVEKLAHFVNTENSELSRAAAFALAELGPDAVNAIPSLNTALSSSDPKLRQVAAWALGLIGPAAISAAPQLVNELKDKNDDIRRVSVDALGRIGAEDHYVIEALTDVLRQDRNLDVKTAAAMSLGEIGSCQPEAASALFKALRLNENPGLKFAAASALSKITPPGNSDIAALVDMTESPYADLREAAVRAIGHVHQQPDKAIPALIHTLNDPIPTVSLASADALGQYGASASSALGDLSSAADNPKLRFVASRTIGNIAAALQDRFQRYPDEGDAAMLVQLEVALQSLERIATSGRSDQIDPDCRASLRDAISILKSNAFKHRLRQWFHNNKLATRLSIGALLYWLWLSFLYGIVLRRFPLTVIGWNEVLQRFGGFKLPECCGGLTISLRDFLLLGSYQHWRVLEAWVERHADRAVVNFRNKGVGKDRTVFCALPIEIAGESLAEPTAEKLRPYCDRDKWLLRIIGEGGVGKTTLACQIGLWAIDRDPVKRLCQSRRMIPVVLERGSGVGLLTSFANFKGAIRGQLRDLISETREVPEWLCDKLLRDRRILVIIDGLSEMNPGSELPLPLCPDFCVAALIITSRTETLWAEASHTDLCPRLIDRDHLLPFMNLYLGRASHTLKDNEVWDACKRLSDLVGTERKITPLLARLYAEQLANASALKKELAKNIPDLVLGYITTLNRNRRPEDPEHSAVHRAAQSVAWECCRRTLNPGCARRDEVVDALTRRDGLKADLLDYLEKRLQVVRSVCPAETHIEFSLDPIAEYLAGLWLVNNLRTDKQWSDFLAEADLVGRPECVSAFLNAVRECCLGTEEPRISSSVLENLQNRIRQSRGPATMSTFITETRAARSTAQVASAQEMKLAAST